MAKYVINENSDLHSLAREVEEIATRQEKETPPGGNAIHEVPVETFVARPGKTRATASNRKLLLGIGLGAAAVIVAAGAFFGVGGMLFTPGMCAVPNVVDQRVDDACAALEAGGFQVVVEYENSGNKPAGTVIAQVPPARIKKPTGSRVLMRVAGNPPARDKQVGRKPGAFELGRPEAAKETTREQPTPTPPKITSTEAGESAPTEINATKLTIPAVEGMNVEEARKLLQDMGLKIVETGAHDAGKPDGAVVSIDPRVGAEIPAGALVRIHINALSDKQGEQPRPAFAAPETAPAVPETAPAASDKVIVQDYTGAPGQDAAKDLYSRGLTPEWRYELSTRHGPGTVITTDPPAGSRIPPGSKVFMVLSR
jgi:beta-lactam-binding protein with PASTA domain